MDSDAPPAETPPAASDAGKKKRPQAPAPSANPDLLVPGNKSTRHIQVSVLMQNWYLNGFGDPISGNSSGAKLPQGRNYGGGGNDAYRLRRAQVAVQGGLLSRLDFYLMLDGAKEERGAGNRRVLQDLYFGYNLSSLLRLEIGQQKTGLSEEGTRSPSRLLTIARAVMNEDLPARAGRIGDARSFGIDLRFRHPQWNGLIGLWDDNGATQNRVDNNSQKFLNGVVYFTGVPHVQFGLWGGFNVLGATPAERRDRGGGTLLWQRGPHFLEIEAAYARDYAAGAPGPGRSGSIARGGYGLYGFQLSRKWQLIARYDNWDPASQAIFTGDATTESGVLIPHANHKLREYTLGINYYLPHDAKVQFNYIREDTEENGGGFFGNKRSLFLVNFQLGFNAPTAPIPQRGAFDPARSEFSGVMNSLRLGLQLSPALGLAAGVDFGIPKARLIPGFRSRITADLLANFNAPSFLGIPGTFYTLTGDQVYALRGNGRYYAGFGGGIYYYRGTSPGIKFFTGARVVRQVGIELSLHFPGNGPPLITFQTRLPL